MAQGMANDLFFFKPSVLHYPVDRTAATCDTFCRDLSIFSINRKAVTNCHASRRCQQLSKNDLALVLRANLGHRIPKYSPGREARVLSGWMIASEPDIPSCVRQVLQIYSVACSSCMTSEAAESGPFEHARQRPPGSKLPTDLTLGGPSLSRRQKPLWNGRISSARVDRVASPHVHGIVRHAFHAGATVATPSRRYTFAKLCRCYNPS